MKYSEYLRGAMLGRLEKIRSNQKALNLLDEVAVMNEIAGQAMANYERAFEKIEEIDNLETRARIQAAATNYVVEAMNQVRDMTVAAARIQDSGKVVDAMQIQTSLAELMTYIEMAARSGRFGVKHPDEMLQDIADHINKEMLTVDAIAKTRLTPERLEREVMAMHDSVPEYNEHEKIA